MHRQVALLAVLAGLAVMAAPASAANTFQVTRTDDPAPGACAAGDCSLREAVTAANGDAAADIVLVPLGTYTLSLGPLPAISQPLTIAGAGAQTTRITGGTASGGATAAGVANVTSSLTLTGVTLTGNSVSGSTAVSAGALTVSGSLTLIDSVISGNTDSAATATGAAGIAVNIGEATIIDSTISGNTKTGSAATLGAGIADNLGTVVMYGSTVSGNTLTATSGAAAAAGIVVNLADLRLVNSTVSGNTATAGGSFTHVGGIRANTSAGDVTSIANSTIAGNSGPGGTANLAVTGPGTFLTSTLIAGGGGGAAGPNCIAGMTPSSGGSNLEDANTCALTPASGDLVGVDPLLGPLQDNGGPTFTQAPALGSPAVNAVTGAAATSCPPTDQRGVLRPQLAACDIGALELVVPPPANTGAPTTSGTPTVGQTLTCDPGTWVGNPSFAFAWLRNGAAIAGANAAAYALTRDDAGAAVQCLVTATNAGGSTAAASAPAGVASGLAVNAARPSLSGAVRNGGQVTCAPGAWTGSPTFAFAWLRNGVAIAGAATSAYRVAARDVGAALQCQVTATTIGGSTVAESAPRVPAQACIVPSLKGSTLASARSRLGRAHCALGKVTRTFSSSVASGRVIRSNPGAAANLSAGTKVGLSLSRGRKKR